MPESLTKFLGILLAWALAVVAATALGSIIQTQVNLAFLAQLGVSVTVGERVSATLHDLRMFTPLYAVLVAIAFAVALPAAGLLARGRPDLRGFWFALAGFAAIAAMLAVMNRSLPVTPIAATRSGLGFLLMALAGAAGGWLYARMRRSQAG